MSSNYLINLTKTQIKIILSSFGPIRVIAGPGSGKTRILTRRIVHLVYEGLDPSKIVALTFTNLASKEMKQRVEKLLNNKYQTPWISTYHSFCYQFLKKWGEIDLLTKKYKFNRKFDIMSRYDQTSLLKRIYNENNITYSDIPYRVALAYIAGRKKKISLNNQILKEIGSNLGNKIFYQYVDYQQNMNLLDFDDLIVFTRKILDEYLEVRKKWQSFISYLLVDEFQDTSIDQAIIVKHLINPNFNNIFVVGDPFQTIYTWRGAKSEFLTSFFMENYNNAKTFSLVENFRSKKTIVKAANIIRNCIISKFQEEKHDNLISMFKSDGNIFYKLLRNNYDQAKYVVNKIWFLYKNNINIKEIAILYRTNRESALYEKFLRLKTIPYKIHGAFAFFDRIEVQDAIAYLALINNSASDMQMERIINSPRKGIGKMTLEKLYKIAKKNKINLQSIILNNNKYLEFSSKTKKKLNILLKALEKAKYEIKINKNNIGNILRDFLQEIGYFGIFEGKIEEDERKDNVEELINDLNSVFEDNNVTLNDYLDRLKLLDGKEDISKNEVVSLMTFHKAKGKEYRYVFVVSLIEGAFPSNASIIMEKEDYSRILEEWKLFYVAITRAKEYLYLTSYQFNHSSCIVSRFLHPLFSILKDDEFLEDEEEEQTKFLTNDNLFQIGSSIYHKTFGIGRVISKSSNKVLVNFDNFGEITVNKKSKLWILNE